MSQIIVVFPPGAGGNHLANMLNKNLDKKLCEEIYQNRLPWVHAKVGNNFCSNDLDKNNITHGHFGEIMSHQHLVRSLADRVQLIILSTDTLLDREILYNRRKKLNQTIPSQVREYFDGEQVFLYEPFMYHYYFNISMHSIMNISISDWFKSDISNELNRIEQFLQIELDKDFCLQLHKIWYQKNFL